MTNEEKLLLLKDLCARLPDGVIVSIPYPTLIIGEKSKKLDIPLISIDLADNTCTVGDSYGKTSGLRMFNRKGELLCKPYLRSMSSMTEGEEDEYMIARQKDIAEAYIHATPQNAIDWLNEYV